MKNLNQITVLGIGNWLMQDEGAGVHVVQHLEQNYRFSPSIQVIDGGTSGSELLSFFDESARVLIVDAVDFHREPGYIGTIKNDQILTHLTTKMSLHHLGITDVLSQAKLLEILPEEIVLIGIQPQIIAVGTELSALLQQKLPQLIELVLQQLQDWGVSCSLVGR